MDQRFARLVELVFTAYAVPALLVPFVWLARRAGRSFRPDRSRSAEGLARAGRTYGALALGWLIVWAVLRPGVPFSGGPLTAAACWTGYGAANLALAWLLVRFTADYGSLPDGAAKDRVFLRVIGAVVAQPVVTALAFSVLYRLLGVAYRLRVPPLAAVQEGL
jgi:hypothetical protein